MSAIQDYFDFSPSAEQLQAFGQVAEFMRDTTAQAFILTGGAGTGKTTLTKALTHYFRSQQIGFVLAAPTGKAAAIISEKTDVLACTLHQFLYQVKELKDEEGNVVAIKFERRHLPVKIERPFCLLVDEASMVSDKPQNTQTDYISDNSVLFDLVDHLRKYYPQAKILFIGDRNQLPPVQEQLPPALSADYLQKVYGLQTRTFHLSQTQRFVKDSVVYRNTEYLRECIEKGTLPKNMQLPVLGKMTQAIGYFAKYYNPQDERAITMIAYRNATVQMLNVAARKVLFGHADLLPLLPGERLITHRNVYIRTITFDENNMPTEGLVTVNNGETGELVSVNSGIEVLPGSKLRFCDVTINFGGRKFSGKISVDMLLNPEMKIDDQQRKALFAERVKVNKALQQSGQSRDDEYLSALYVRYAYALTCHKAQGSEWDRVIVAPEMLPANIAARWYYTAVSRARQAVATFGL